MLLDRSVGIVSKDPEEGVASIASISQYDSTPGQVHHSSVKAEPRCDDIDPAN